MREYQAPEIKGGKGYNPASDIYAFGQLGIDLIRLNYMMLTESPDAPAKLPLKLMHILDTCLDADPKERYEAALMGFMLEEIMDKLEDANTEWVDEYEFPAASTHESRLLSLPSTLGSRSG
jgi:serine/threonine protein kinase